MTPDITTKTISATAAAITAATTAAGELTLATTIESEVTTSQSLPPPSPASLPQQFQSTVTQPTLPSVRPSSSSLLLSSSALVTKPSSIMRRHLLTIEKLRNRVHQILKCVINLHIDILVLESNVSQLLDDVKEFNADLMEVQRLDNLIQTLRDYNGPTICHEWPFPLVCQGTIDEADLAQTLNTNDIFSTA